MKIWRGQTGFTLVELMVVVLIMGVLAGIAIPQFMIYRERAFIASMHSDVNTARVAEEAYFADRNTYTATLTDLAGFGCRSLSPDITLTITVTAGPPSAYKIDARSSKTTRTVSFDSATGVTATSA